VQLYFSFNLDEGDTLTIEFEVILGGNKDIDLYIENSNGVKVADYGRVITGTIYFNAPSYDTFRVYFSNSFSIITSKTVEISFDITYAKSITIHSPRSTDLFENGCNDIHWTTIGSILSVRIELYIGPSFSEVITEMTHNDGSFAWCLSSGDIYDGSNYRIRISDYYDNSIYTFSDYFTIEIEQGDSDDVFIPIFLTVLLLLIIPAVLTIAVVLIHRRRKQIPKEIIPITREIPVKEELVKTQESKLPRITYCSSCGAEILDKTGDFCSKCGAPFK